MQNTSNKGLDLAGYIVLIICGGVILSPLLIGISNFFISLKQRFILIYDFIIYELALIKNLNSWILIIIAFITSIFLLIFLFKMAKYLLIRITNIISEYLKEKRLIKSKTTEIESLLETEVKSDFQDLKNEIENVRGLIIVSESYKKLNCFTIELKERLKTCLKLLEELKKKLMAEGLKKEIEYSERKIEELDEKIRIRESYDDPEDYVIYTHLKADEKQVFKKSQLSKRQVKALEQFGFVQQNEYSMIEHKYIRYMINSRSNHTPTHTFLVWEMHKLLKTIEGVTNIKEHLAVDADITFKFNNKYYAIEAEKGDLLRKKDQTQIKLDYLNRKYRKRWMFLVSNKNLLPKYQKLGFSTQRSRVLKNLKVLLKIA